MFGKALFGLVEATGTMSDRLVAASWEGACKVVGDNFEAWPRDEVAYVDYFAVVKVAIRCDVVWGVVRIRLLYFGRRLVASSPPGLLRQGFGRVCVIGAGTIGHIRRILVGRRCAAHGVGRGVFVQGSRTSATSS